MNEEKKSPQREQRTQHDRKPKNQQKSTLKNKRKKTSSSFNALKQKLRKLEKELDTSKRERDEAVGEFQPRFQEHADRIEILEKENRHLIERLERLSTLNSSLHKENLRSKEQLLVIKEKMSKKINYQTLFDDERKKHEETRKKLKELQNGDGPPAGDKVVEILARMDEFIDNGIKEREELIRNIDRIRDRSVQTIRILEQEKAVNLGLLKTQKVSRKIAARVGVYVDVQNMFYAARQQFNGRLDFQRFLSSVLKGRRLHKAVAYIIETPDVDQKNFISLLTHCGYEVKSKELRTRLDGSAKGNWDMEMALDMISVLPHIDVMILASGDGDFVPLIQKIKQEYKIKCEIFGFEHNTAVDLKEIADIFYPIGKDLILETVTDRNAQNGSSLN